MVDKLYQNEHFVAIAHHKVGEDYCHILVERNKYVFSAAPHLCRGWTEAQRRRHGHQSVSLKTEDACLRQGTTLW